MHEAVKHDDVPPDAHHKADEQIDVMDYLFDIWHHRWIVSGVTIACGLVTLTVGLLTTPTYESTTKLLVSPPRVIRTGDTPPLTVNVSTYRALVENQVLAAAVIKEYGLDGEPLHLRADEFLSKCLTVETVRETNVLAAHVRMPTAELASKVANRVAQLAVELARTIAQDEAIRARDFIKAQLDQSQKRFAEESASLQNFRRQAQVEALRKDIEAALGQRSTLLPLLVEIQAERGRLTAAEEQLAKRERVTTLRRTIDSDPALMEAARETSGNRALMSLQTKNETIDKVYEEIDQQAATSRTKLSGLERQKAELVDVLKLDSSQLSLLNTLYARETELARAQTEFDLAKAAYLDVSTVYEESRLQVASRTSQLQVMEPALPSSHPIAPRVVRNTAVALVAGMMLGGLAAVFVSALRSRSSAA